MTCWGKEHHTPEDEANMECPECGGDTVDGVAVEICAYSIVECNTCGYAPCTGAC
jgi:uncharacterized Zn finger protein